MTKHALQRLLYKTHKQDTDGVPCWCSFQLGRTYNIHTTFCEECREATRPIWDATAHKPQALKTALK
jgi:hypothetical protein